MPMNNSTGITEAERAQLIEMFDKQGLPHVVSETHYIISSDMQHDNAMIQKLLDEPNNADAAQHEAHKIFKSNPEEYKRRVRAQMQLPGIKDSAAATGGA